MNNAYAFLRYLAALAIVTCVGCGTPLRLLPDPAADGGVNANTAISPNDTKAIFNPNAVTDANGAINPNGSPVIDPNALKCHTADISGAQLSNCTCSTDNNQYCPIYAANANVGTHAWDCTTVAVSGGYAYSCECATSGDSNVTAAACGAFYDPVNPNATQNSNAPVTTCQTVATSFGFQTICTCVDTNTAPCDFYQGNSYSTASASYIEVCGSTLHATGATTVCTCNQLLQSAGATCPSTFVPNAQTVTDLIY